MTCDRKRWPSIENHRLPRDFVPPATVVRRRLSIGRERHRLTRPFAVWFRGLNAYVEKSGVDEYQARLVPS